MADQSKFIAKNWRHTVNWRDWLRKNTSNGAEIHQILLSLARGQPKRVKLLDGKTTVIVPTAEVRARVAIHLDEMLHGKAVTQNEQTRAEREAGALRAVQALSDAVLADRAAAALLRVQAGLPQLTEGPLGPAEDADFEPVTVDSVQKLPFAEQVWLAVGGEE